MDPLSKRGFPYSQDRRVHLPRRGDYHRCQSQLQLLMVKMNTIDILCISISMAKVHETDEKFTAMSQPTIM